MRVFALALFAAATIAPAGRDARAQAPAPRVIEITAERFEFWPSDITIVEGEPVVFHIRSDDTLHGFRIVGTATNVAVPKRGKGTVTLAPGPLSAGRYTFECSRLCGAGHNFMRGVLNVRPRPQAAHDQPQRRTTDARRARPAAEPGPHHVHARVP
jgi:cytochrome c oxidase subunit 2